MKRAVKILLILAVGAMAMFAAVDVYKALGAEPTCVTSTKIEGALLQHGLHKISPATVKSYAVFSAAGQPQDLAVTFDGAGCADGSVVIDGPTYSAWLETHPSGAPGS